MKIKTLTLVFISILTLILSSISYYSEAAPGPGRSVKRSGPASSGGIKKGPSRSAKKNTHKKVKKKKRRRNVVRTAAVVSLTSSAFRSRSCTTTTIIAHGVTYYSSCGSWYTRGYSSGVVVYIESSNPPGY